MGRLPAPSVHLEVRLFLERLDRNERLPVFGGQPKLGSTVAARCPDGGDEVTEKRGRGAGGSRIPTPRRQLCGFGLLTRFAMRIIWQMR